MKLDKKLKMFIQDLFYSILDVLTPFPNPKNASLSKVPRILYSSQHIGILYTPAQTSCSLHLQLGYISMFPHHCHCPPESHFISLLHCCLPFSWGFGF